MFSSPSRIAAYLKGISLSRAMLIGKSFAVSLLCFIHVRESVGSPVFALMVTAACVCATLIVEKKRRRALPRRVARILLLTVDATTAQVFAADAQPALTAFWGMPISHRTAFWLVFGALWVWDYLLHHTKDDDHHDNAPKGGSATAVFIAIKNGPNRLTYTRDPDRSRNPGRSYMFVGLFKTVSAPESHRGCSYNNISDDRKVSDICLGLVSAEESLLYEGEKIVIYTGPQTKRVGALPSTEQSGGHQ
jgi:hypothetical protein